ncbi:hypothetical protein [Nonomuraea sp. NPDC049400]|uniref:hypothetical protein n=1 Tax=Nonomuraea sp. NPDC049400 TaxID=3364352 RepID=UPI0037BBA676
MPAFAAETTDPERNPRDQTTEAPALSGASMLPGTSGSPAAPIDDSDTDHERDMVASIVDHLAGRWPELPLDTAPALVRDVLAAAAAFQDARAEELLNQVLLHGMGPTASGGIEIVTSAPPEITAVFVSWAHAMLGPAPNYVEQAFEFTSRATDERFAITVQRVGPGKLTPHEARTQAEQDRDVHAKQVTDLRKRLDEVQQSMCAACRADLAATIRPFDE